MALAIVFRPRANGQINSFIFHYAIPRLGAARKAAKEGDSFQVPVEMDLLEIKPGVNFIQPEIWKMVTDHGQNGSVISGMQAKGSLSVYNPDVNEPVGATSDFSSLTVVEDIIRNAVDEDWLQRSIARDSRETVFKLGSQRIQEIKESKIARSQTASSLEMV